MNHTNFFEKMGNSDYMLAYNAVRAAVSCCPAVKVFMSKKMIRNIGIADEMEIGGMPVTVDKDDIEFSVVADGKSGSHIIFLYDRGWGAFRCSVSSMQGARKTKYFRVEPNDLPNFLYEATTV